MKMWRKLKGFTLLEVLIVIVIVGIIAAICSKMLMQGLLGYLTLQNTTNATWQGQIAMERMTRDIRYVRSKGDIATMTSTQFSFTDIYGDSVSYKLSGSNLVRNSQILASGVSSLSFTYKDKSGNTITSSADGMYVTVNLNFSSNGGVYALQTSILLDDLSS